MPWSANMLIDTLATVAVIAVASITPGPNNLLVMALASKGGLRAAFPAIAAIVAGSLLLLILAWIGASELLASSRGAGVALPLAGSAYLAWMGARAIAAGSRTGTDDVRLPASSGAILLLQFANPKAWLLAGAVTAAAIEPRSSVPRVALACLLLVLTCTVCLSAWAAGGAAMSCWLTQPRARRLFNLVTGLMLLVSAPLMFL